MGIEFLTAEGRDVLVDDGAVLHFAHERAPHQKEAHLFAGVTRALAEVRAHNAAAPRPVQVASLELADLVVADALAEELRVAPRHEVAQPGGGSGSGAPSMLIT